MKLFLPPSYLSSTPLLQQVYYRKHPSVAVSSGLSFPVSSGLICESMILSISRAVADDQLVNLRWKELKDLACSSSRVLCTLKMQLRFSEKTYGPTRNIYCFFKIKLIRQNQVDFV